MNTLEYYANLRSEIIEVLSGVKNANCNIGWDNTTPNFLIRRALREIHNKYLKLATDNFGIYVVTRHSDCNQKNHYKIDDGYPTSNNYGLDIKYINSKYIWTGIQIYQGDRICICPCTNNNTKSNHWVIDELVYDPEVRPDIKKEIIADILEDIYIAQECSGDKQPRASIREYLLRAIIKINDQILPIPVDEFIKKYIQTTA